MILSAALAMLLLQAGPNPATGAIPGVPEELRNRPARTAPAQPSAVPSQGPVAECFALAATAPQSALDRAQRLRETADDQSALAHSSHCLGLALTSLGRFDEARLAFEMASDEASIADPAYRARLAGMAGNAALAEDRADLALPLLAGAVDSARPAGDAALSAGLMLDHARALVALDRGAEAASILATARSTDPSAPLAWLLSATLARRDGRLDEAQALIERAATLAPRDAAIGLEAGVIAALGGRDAAARASFASVVELAPDSDEAAQARAYLEQLQP